MQNKIKLAVFDMAGTTVNEGNVVYKTLQKAINNAGYKVELDFVLTHGAGKEKHQAIKDVLEELNEDKSKSDVIFEDFKVLLDEAYKKLAVKACNGVEELFKLLKSNNIKVALNTGYNKEIATLLLNKLNWTKGEQYDVLITADDVVNGRPSPDMISKAMELTNVLEADKVLKAGDSIIDIEEGKNANCAITVGVTTGAHTKEQLLSAHPTYVVASLLELKDILLK